VEIRQIRTKDDAENVVFLVRQFVQWLRDRYPDKHAEIDAYFESQVLEEQLSSIIESSESAPCGVLLALMNDEPAGTVMLNRVDDATCEMNRLFVPDEYRGHDIGRRLCVELIDTARRLGYHRMRLSTGVHHTEAKGLYSSLGFRPCEKFHAGTSISEFFDLSLN
jgi:GNAT superfamily N-acetyltransferase